MSASAQGNENNSKIVFGDGTKRNVHRWIHNDHLQETIFSDSESDTIASAFALSGEGKAT